MELLNESDINASILEEKITDNLSSSGLLFKNRDCTKNNLFDPNTVGQFRKDLNELKELRAIIENNNLIKRRKKEILIMKNSEWQDIQIKQIETAIETEESYKETRSISEFHFKLPALNSFPSNPLTDQTVQVISPTKWIDCISRESKRIFVKDNWIVARIQLPTINKDELGLKRI